MLKLEPIKRTDPRLLKNMEIHYSQPKGFVGQTIGYTCKRVAGKGTDDWSGKRVWDTKNLRPKLVFARKV